MNKLFLFLVVIFFLSLSTIYANNTTKQTNSASEYSPKRIQISELMILKEIIQKEKLSHTDLYFYTFTLFVGFALITVLALKNRKEIEKKFAHLEFENRELSKELDFTKRFSEELFKYIKSIEKERKQLSTVGNEMTMM